MSTPPPSEHAEQPEQPAPAETWASALQETARTHRRAASWMAEQTHDPGVWRRPADAHRRRAATLENRAAATEEHRGPSLPAELLAAPRPAPGAATPPRRAVEQALEAAEQLPGPEAGITRPRLGLRLGIICDRFLLDTFAGAAELLPITPQNWREQLGEVDVLLVAATWRGHDGASWDVTGEGARARRTLLVETLIPAFRAAGVPTVYYGKEDPPDYRRFLDVARACEHILTTAAEVVPQYRADCPAARSIEVLPFGVNPLLHSPLGGRPAGSELIPFAGSWMGRKYPSRAEQGRWILDGVLAADRPLALIDRHYDAEDPSPNQLVPFEYWPHRAPSMGHEQLMGLQRTVDIAINFNSVQDSQTMFANRALELQASGTMVLSTYSQGLNSHHPQVHIANSAEDVAATLRHLTSSAAGHEDLRRIQGDGIRRVFLDHHVVDLLSRVAAIAGVSVETPGERVLAVSEEPTETLRADLRTQSAGSVDLVRWEDLPARADDYDILLPVSPDRRYEPDYVADHLAGLRFQSAPMTVKLENRPDGGLDAATDAASLTHRRAGDETSWELTALHRPQETLGDPALLGSPARTEQAARGLRSLALDSFQHRRTESTVTVSTAGADADETPEHADTEEPLQDAAARTRAVAAAEGLDLSVIVPIFDNGHHLRHKAFASLRRSPGFSRMHVLLVDDGSTDGVTPAIVAELARTHANVTAYHHAPGGSGSASRPRNTGLALAATEYTTYLDPDDEQLGDSYSRMADRLAAAEEANFALAAQITWTDRRLHLDVHSWLREGVARRDGLRRPTRDSLRETRFRPASIESMVFRTAWLQSLGLEQPVGATGQDTFFFQQLLFHAEAYLEVEEPAYVYYGAVETSIVNAISPGYFRKYLLLETARAAWLREVGLMQDYLDTRFESFFVGWYLDKLDRVPATQRAEAAGVLDELARCYVEDPRAHPWTTAAARRFFGLPVLPRVGMLRPAALRPVLGRLARRGRGEATLALERFRGTPAGRRLGTVYRRTLKPAPSAERGELLAALREETDAAEDAGSPVRAAAEDEDALEALRIRLLAAE